MNTPQIETFILGEFQTNCFVVSVPPSSRCWIVDCGFEPQDMLGSIQRNGLQPIAILLTHAHSDHIAGLDLARARFNDPPVYLHEAERCFCSDPMLNLSAYVGRNVSVSEPDHWLRGGETLELEGTKWRVLHAPGHCPGGVLYVHDDSNQAIVGDTLFAGSIGRSDFPTSNPDDLRRTIRDVLMSLPDEMRIYPGHGPPTTIGRERAMNRYVIQGF